MLQSEAREILRVLFEIKNENVSPYIDNMLNHAITHYKKQAQGYDITGSNENKDIEKKETPGISNSGVLK